MAEEIINPAAQASSMFSGIGDTFSGLGSSFGHFMGTWGVFIFQMTIVFAVIGGFWWFVIKNNHKVLIKTHSHNRFHWTRGRRTFDTKTKSRGFKIMGVPNWSGDDISENYIGYTRTSMGTKPFVMFCHDKDGNLHPVSITESEAFLKVNVLTSVEKDIFLNQVEKANRKYPLSAESWVKTTMLMLIVCLVIVFGGTSFVTYKQSKAMDVIGRSMDVNSATNEKLANIAAGVSTVNTVPNPPSGTNPTVITPFNNVVGG